MDAEADAVGETAAGVDVEAAAVGDADSLEVSVTEAAGLAPEAEGLALALSLAGVEADVGLSDGA